MIQDRAQLQQPQAKDVVHVEHSIVLTSKITVGQCSVLLCGRSKKLQSIVEAS